MAKDAFRNLLLGPSALQTAVCVFNLYPQTFIHSSRLPQPYSQELLNTLDASERGRGPLAEALLDHFEIRDCFHFDFSSADTRLALVEGEDLEAALVVFGAAVNADLIGGLISGQKVREVKQHLGEEIYTFALKNARFRLGMIPQNFEPKPNHYNWREFALSQGIRRFAAVLGKERPALWRRVRLKFERQWDSDFERPLQSEHSAAWARILRKILTVEVNPQWKPLFTS